MPSTCHPLAKTSDLKRLAKSPLVCQGAFFSSMPNRLFRFIVAMLIAGLLAAVYWGGLSGGFFFDDIPNLLVAPGVQLEALTWSALQQAWTSGTAGPLGRPVAMLSFALNYYVFGFNPFAFKLTNLLIHVLCGVLVYVVTLHLVTDVSTDRHADQQANRCAAVVAAFWLLHPIQVLAVLYVVQRMTSLSALFLLAAFYLHILARSGHGWRAHVALAVSWSALWPLSLLSKETGALFPVFVLAWEVLVRWQRTQRLDRFATIYIALSLIITGAATAYLLYPASQWLWSGYALRDFTLMERVYTEGRVVWFYIGLIMFPRLGAFGLYHDDLAISTSLWTPWTTLPALLGLATVVVVICLVRKRAPLVAFGLAWFLIGHALESTVLPLEIAHEHRNYLPLFGLVLAVVQGVPWVIAAKEHAKASIALLTGAGLLVCVGMTALRAYQFGEPVRRTQMEAHNHPASARTQYEAGATLLGLSEPTEQTIATARNHFVVANAVDAHFKAAAQGLIQLNCRTTHLAGTAEVDDLAQRLGSTPFAPGDRNILYSVKEMMSVGTLCLTRPEVDKLFTAALANPTVSSGVAAMLHSWHADYLWLNQHDMKAARAALGRSMELNPVDSSNRLKWAQLLYISGERVAAGTLLRALKRENLSIEEHKTVDELLGAITIQTP